MRILAVSDTEAKCFYDYYVPGKLAEYDLILACGDLKPKYLEFLVTMARCPVMYVNGNHDEMYAQCPPEGCDCIDDKLVVYKGVRILGLGGSYKYRNGKYMFTERQMNWRIRKLRGKIRKNKGFDILVTHAPAYGLNDMDDLAHRGFECFNELLEKYKPRYFIHGHVHMEYGHEIPRRTELEHTTVINACGYYAFDYEVQPQGTSAQENH